MRKIFAFIIFAGLCFACGDDDDPQPVPQNPDSTQSDSTATDSIPTDSTQNDSIPIDTTETVLSDSFFVAIAYNGSNVTLSGETDSLKISKNGAHLTVTSNSTRFMTLSVSGSTDNGSLLVYSQKKYGITLKDASITNPTGPAINNQCSKSLFVTLSGENTLNDGDTYGTAPTDSTGAQIDQKGTLFSEGQIYFRGTGSLTVNGNGKNGIASDDYIVFEENTNIKVNIDNKGSNGVKANDGVFIQNGTLNIIVETDGGRGIKCDSCVTVSGGTTTIKTTGDCVIETVEGVEDASSSACIKCDDVFTMTGGTLTLNSSGDGGKGINAAKDVLMKGGTLVAKTSGSNDEGKPKAVKSDTGIILSGGSFTAQVDKSWACDNGSTSDEPADHVTIVGTPQSKSVAKKLVKVVF